MKITFILIIILITAPTFGQEFIQPDSNSEFYSKSSKIKVFEDNGLTESYSDFPTTAFFINGMLANEILFKQLEPQNIENVDVIKGKFEQKERTYLGKIEIRTKSDFTPKLITLKQLAETHLNLDSSPIVFQIDNVVIEQDYSNYLVNENFILKIIKSTIKSPGSNSNIHLISLITKTPENIEKANLEVLKSMILD